MYSFVRGGPAGSWDASRFSPPTTSSVFDRSNSQNVGVHVKDNGMDFPGRRRATPYMYELAPLILTEQKKPISCIMYVKIITRSMHRVYLV